MSKFLSTVLLAGFSATAMADVVMGPYVGGNLGGGWMSGKKSFVFDNIAGSDRLLFNNKGCFGGAVNALIGYRDKIGGLNMGGELALGFSLYKQELKEDLEMAGCIVTVSDKVKRGMQAGIVGIAGYDFGNFCLSGKIGLGVAQFVHDATILEDGDVGETKKMACMSPALITGFLVETDLTSDVSLRLDYSLWIHQSVDQSFVAKNSNYLTLRQKLVSPKMQSLTIGAVWHF